MSPGPRPCRRGPCRALLLLVLVASACTGGGGAVDPTPAPPADPLLDIAERDGSVVVIVGLAVPRGSAGSWDTAAIGRAQREVVAALGPHAGVVERFGRKLPQIALRVKPEGLPLLRQSPLVVNVTLHTADQATD